MTQEAPLPPKPPVAIKGRGSVMTIAIDSTASADAIMHSLDEQLSRRGRTFLDGAPTAVEVRPGPLDPVLVARLAERLAGAGMVLVEIRSADSPSDRSAPPSAPPAAVTPVEGALLVTRTLRGGQRISHDGTVVILGDVNPGAEIVAGGHVVVWGRLRGTVEAGLSMPGATVCALDLAPTQLRIGPAIARAPEEPDRVPVPEVAREVDGRIVVEGWRTVP
ncbi:MAG: septum site-determining protein MinC [Ardenticatenales bacterium]